MTAIRWAICGLGKISERFLAAVRHLEHCEVVGCISSDLARAEAFKQKHGLRFAADYGCAGQIRDKVDAVYVCTNMHLHRKNTLDFLSAGIPCLVEKSFALDETEAQEMIDAATRRQVLLMEAMWTVFLPSAKQVKAIVEGGALGKPLSVSAKFCCDMTGSPDSRVFKRELGGGSILDLMVYNVAYTQMLFGKPLDISSACTMQNGVDLDCTAALTYPGFTASLESSIAAAMPAEGFTARFQNGTVTVPAFYGATAFTVTDTSGNARAYTFESVPGFIYQIEHFNALIRNNVKESPVRSLADTILTMAALTKMSLGAKEGACRT